MQSIRRSVFITVFILLMFGAVMIYSSSAIYAYEHFGDSAFFLKRHLVFLFLGFLLMLFTMSFSVKRAKEKAKPLLAGAIFLLLIILIPKVGFSAGGARRWFRIGFLSLQPSEFAKFALIIYLASFLSRKGYRIKDFFYGYLPCVLVASLTCFLILLQPDFGTAVAIFCVSFLIIFVAGGNLKHMIATILLGLPFLCYLLLGVPYRRKRILAFLDPWGDRQGSGFQLVQSFLALGSGGLLGVGLGQSKQKLFYLPESHTDFIFSIIGEELGFLGAGSIVILFSILAWQGMRAAFKENRPFNKILIFGITSMIAVEVLVNIGVSAGAFPTKGLPLPFISYGGSSLIFHMAAVGLMLNAMRE